MAHCHRQLLICLQRSVIKDRFAFGNDPRHISLPSGHAWLAAHQSHHLARCDIAVFCRNCGASSSGSKTRAMTDPCNPANATEHGKSFINKHHFQMKTKLMRADCPYSSGMWMSNLDGRANIPPVEVFLFVDGNKCPITCTCSKGRPKGRGGTLH